MEVLKNGGFTTYAVMREETKRNPTQVASNSRDCPLVITRDFNTGQTGLDVEGGGARFHCVDLFVALSKEAGLIDLWRVRNGDEQEWTWRSVMNGFRIDHAFGHEAFTKRFRSFKCEIDHEPQLSRLTDHSAVVMRLNNRRSTPRTPRSPWAKTALDQLSQKLSVRL